MNKWKQIEGYDKYFISKDGVVKTVYKNGKEYIHKKRLNKDGYVKVTLTKRGIAKDYGMHRLVALHFIKNPNNFETVNHEDGNKENNNVSNLKWMNRSNQMKHAYRLGLKNPSKGENNVNSLLTNEQVEEIRSRHCKFSKKDGAVAIAKDYNVSNSVVDRIVNFKTYI